jgi:hypothetical protein
MDGNLRNHTLIPDIGDTGIIDRSWKRNLLVRLLIIRFLLVRIFSFRFFRFGFFGVVRFNRFFLTSKEDIAEKGEASFKLIIKDADTSVEEEQIEITSVDLK